MDPNRPWLSGSSMPGSGYPGRMPVTGPLPVALPGLDIHHRDPRFRHRRSGSQDLDGDFTANYPLPTYEETWDSDNASETRSRILATESATGNSYQGRAAAFHSTTLSRVQPNDRQSSSQSEGELPAASDVATPATPAFPVPPRRPSETPSQKSKKKKNRGFFGHKAKKRRKSQPFLAGLVHTHTSPPDTSDGVLLSPNALTSGSGGGSYHSGSGTQSEYSGSGSWSGTGSGSSFTGSTTESSSSDSSSDSDDDRPFLDYLDEEMQDSLRDGEDFDYIGLVAHPAVGQDEEKMKENLEAMKEIVRKVKDQPWRMRRKLKLYRLGHVYIERYEGRLSSGRANAANLAKFFKLIQRNFTNFLAVMVPWEERIKSIENRFGSAAASYFTLLRWIIGVNVVQTLFIVGFVMVPQIIFGDKDNTTFRTTMTTQEIKTGLEWSTIYHYAGYMLYTVMYYGYYGDEKKYSFGYRLPLAYFATTVAVFLHSFWVVLAKMAANVREGTGSGESDQYLFSMRTYCSWDYMIANRDTGDNKVAAVSRSFKELILDEHHKGKEENKWLRLFLRILAWVITGLLLALSVYILTEVMKWKKNFKDPNPNFFESNVQSLSLKAVGMVFPEFFERLEVLEEYHPLTALRMHLTRITMLNLLTNYALINNWIGEANLAFEESVHAKPAFPWIWNASNTVTRPTVWESLTYNPNLGGHGGGHGDAAAGGHSASSSAEGGHGATATGGHGSAAISEHGTPAASGHETSAVGEHGAATHSDHGVPAVSEHGAAASSAHGPTAATDHGVSAASGHGAAEGHAPSDMAVVGHGTITLAGHGAHEGATNHGQPAENSHTGDHGTQTAGSDHHLSTTAVNAVLVRRQPDFSLGGGEPIQAPNSIQVAHIGPRSVVPTHDTEVHGTLHEVAEPSGSVVVHEAGPAHRSDHAETHSAVDSHIALPAAGLEESPANVSGFGPERNHPPIGVDFIPGGKDLFPPATQSPYTVNNRTSGSIQYINTWPTLEVRTPTTTTPSTPPPVTHPIITIQMLKDQCWENKVAFEGLENLVTESITGVIEVVVTELIRDVFVRFMAKCWFWDLETTPGYAHFRISENVLGLIVGQQMTWIAFFFSPALIPINLVRLLFLMYFRSWVTHVCCVPPETMFNTGKGNNFYFFILLLMLFVSTLFFGYTVFFLSPSWQCGPFSQYKFMYEVLVDNVGSLPETANQIINYVSSPALIIPFIMMLAIIIFYLFSVRMALVKHTKQLKRTLEIERTEERRKMLAQLEEKKKRAQQKLLGAANATGEELQVTIDQANENTKSLLDKMQNRGFPPEEHPGPGVVIRRKSSIFHPPPDTAPAMEEPAQTVIVMNTIARRLSQLPEEGQYPATLLPTDETVAPTNILISAKVARSKEKFKRKRRNMPAVMEAEETVTDTVIEMEGVDEGAHPVPDDRGGAVLTQQETTLTTRMADSDSIRTA